MVHVVRIPCKSQKFFINLLYACKFKSPVGLIFDDGRAGVQDFRQSHCDVITTTCPSKKKKKRTVFPGLFALVLLSAWVCGDIGCFFFCLERESVREEKEGFGALVGLARRKSTDSFVPSPRNYRGLKTQFASYLRLQISLSNSGSLQGPVQHSSPHY